MPPYKKRLVKKAKVDEEVENADLSSTVVSGQLSKKLRRQHKSQVRKQRGIVFIKHLPHGFFEEQLKKYFEQFGTVTRLRLVRSRRTGGSKGFAFVEFEYPEVAQVAAETMDNYLMFQKLVKAAYIPPEKQLFNYFKTRVRKIKNKAGQTIFVSGKTAAIRKKAEKYNDWSEEKTIKSRERNLKKIKQLNEKYGHLGLDFSTICLGGNTIKANKTDDEKEGETTKKDKEIQLADLLGNTIQEDSDDDEWNASEIEEDLLDESLYLDEEASDVSDNDSDIECEDSDGAEITKPKTKSVKKEFGKSTKGKLQKDRLEKLIKRKPQTGGIKKVAKKQLKKPSPLLPKAARNEALLSSAKEVAKPLSQTSKVKNVMLKKKSVNKKK